MSKNKRLITDIINLFNTADKYKNGETGAYGIAKALSSDDVASLENYNQLLKQGKSYNEAFELSLKNASTSAQNMAINAGGATVKLEKMTVAEKAASVATSLLSKTIKLFTNAIIVVAINIFKKWIGKLINSIKEAKQNFAEFSNNFSDNMKSAKDEQNSLDKTISQYIDLTANTKDLTSAKKDLQTIQDSLNEQYGNEAKNIDLVNGKLSEQIQNLVQLKKQKAKEKLSEESNITDPNNKDQKLTNRYAGEYAKNKLKETSSFKTRIRYNNGADLVTGNGIEELYGISGDNATVIDPKGLVDFSEYEVFNILQKYKDNIRLYNSQIYSVGTIEEQLKSLQSFYDELNKLWENKSADSDEKKFLNNLFIEVSNLEKNYNNLNGALTIYNELIKQADESNIKLTDDQQKRYDSFFSDMKNQYLSDRENLNFQAMNDDYQKLSDTKNELVKLFNDNDNKEMAQKVEEFFNSIPKPLNTKTFVISEFSDHIDNLQTKIKSLKETLSKLKDGSITQDELIDFTQEYGLTEYLDDLPELQKQIEKLLKTSPDDLINTLSELRNNVDETDSEKITELIIVLRQLGSTSESVDSVSESIQRLEDEISAIDEKLSKLNDEKKSLEDTISTIESNNSNIVSVYEYQVDKVIDKLQDEVDVHQRIVDKYEAKNELLEDENDKLQDQADIIQEILNNYDTSSNVVQNFIDKQIDSLEERKSKIQEENDSLNETINLEEKLNNLRNAKRKRVRIYNEQGGWQLGEDTSAVQSAEKEYRDAVTDKKTSDIDKQIEGWKNYAQQWSDTVDNINNKQDELTANEILGSNWRKKITNKDIGILKKFGSEYTNYKNKLENNINAKIKKNEADIKKNEEVIKTENKVIKSKNAVIDKWQEYKNKLSDFVDETSKKSNEYINSLSNVTLSEKSSYSDRTKFFNDYKQALVNGYKEISKAKAQLNDVENTIGSLENDKKNKENQKSKLENQQKSGTTTKKQYKLVNTKTGSIVGTSENKKSLEKTKADLDKTLVEKTIRNQFANVPEPTKSKAIKDLINEYTANDKAIAEYLKHYNLNNKYVIKSYSTGGTVDYTGLANVHGSKSNSEVIFNSAQAKKLYDFVANTGSLSEVIGRQVAQDLGNKTINNIVNNNDKADNSKTNITIRVDKIVTPNANDFMNQMTNLIRQSNRNRMVGK